MVILLAGLLACATQPVEPEPEVPTWTQPAPTLIEHRITLPESQRKDLVPRVRIEMMEVARQQGFRRLETIEVQFRCESGECEATIQAMALP